MSAAAPFNPSDPRAPKYWQHETSGIVRAAVEAYLNGGPMTIAQLAAMRAYLRQWILSPAWDLNPYGAQELSGLRDAINSLTNRAQIHTWLRKALDIGIDPL